MNFLRRAVAALLIAALALSPLGSLPARATVNSSVNKTIVLGNGSQTQFTFSFIGVAAAYISVILTDSGGNETVLTQGAGATQYQITLNNPVPGAIWGIGGTVTYNPSGTPIPSGSTLTIFRTLPLTQAISLANQSSVQTLGKGSETGLDTGVMQGQQIAENIGRAIVAPIVDATPPAPLPPIAQRANQGAAFDSAGNLVAGSTPASGVISSAMQPVVDAASLALGRTAFGLGNIAVENIGAGLQDDGSNNVRVNTPLQQVASNQSIHAANHLDVYAASGTLTFTLDRANTLFSGFAITVLALTGPITFAPDANDNFYGQSSGASLTIPQGSSATIMTNGASSGLWVIDVTPGLSFAIAGALQRLAGVLQVVVASKADQQAATSALNVVTPLHQQDHPSAAKAWAFFLNTTAIQSSYNVSGVVRNGTGDYTVSFTVPFAAAVPACSIVAGSASVAISPMFGALATSSVEVLFRNSTSAALVDPALGMMVTCFGTQ